MKPDPDSNSTTRLEADADDGSSEKGKEETKKKKVTFGTVGLPEISRDHLQREDHVLGGGSYGQVERRYHGATEVAVKVFFETNKEQFYSMFRDEIDIVRQLQQNGSHPNIVQCFGFCDDRPNLFNCLVFEIASGSLQQYLKQGGHRSHGAPGIMKWAQDAARGVKFMHSELIFICHFDIKPGNMLLFQRNFLLKLCDFGLSRKMKITDCTDGASAKKESHGDCKTRGQNTRIEVVRGTRYTAAPETIRTASGNSVNDPRKCDVYSWAISFGIVGYDDLNYGKRKAEDVVFPKGETDHVPLNDFEWSWKHKEGYRPTGTMHEGIPDEFAVLLQKCWDLDPDKRPTMAEVVRRLERISNVHRMFDEDPKPRVEADENSLFRSRMDCSSNPDGGGTGPAPREDQSCPAMRRSYVHTHSDIVEADNGASRPSIVLAGDDELNATQLDHAYPAEQNAPEPQGRVVVLDELDPFVDVPLTDKTESPRFSQALVEDMFVKNLGEFDIPCKDAKDERNPFTREESLDGDWTEENSKESKMKRSKASSSKGLSRFCCWARAPSPGTDEIYEMASIVNGQSESTDVTLKRYLDVEQHNQLLRPDSGDHSIADEMYFQDADAGSYESLSEAVVEIDAPQSLNPQCQITEDVPVAICHTEKYTALPIYGCSEPAEEEKEARDGATSVTGRTPENRKKTVEKVRNDIAFQYAASSTLCLVSSAFHYREDWLCPKRPLRRSRSVPAQMPWVDVYTWHQIRDNMKANTHGN